MTRFIQIILFILITSLVAPLPASAALVPVCNSVFKADKTFADPCTICHLFILLDNIIDFLVKISFVLAGFFIAWGGILILVAGGNPGKIEEGKKAMTAAIMGLLIVLVSWVVIDTVLLNLANPAAFPGWAWPWHTINCP